MTFRMGWKIIWGERGRLVITISGISVTVLMVLFLIGLYHGVKEGATSYLTHCQADLWIAQKNSTNLIRNSSFLPSSAVSEVRKVEGVGSATAILRTMCAAKIRGELVTLIIIGIDPASSMATPSTILSGAHAIKVGDIILDEAFCRKYQVVIGDSIEISGHLLAVTGICTESNAIVAQFAYTSLDDAQRLLGFPGTISFILARVQLGYPIDSLKRTLLQCSSAISVFSKDEFIENTLQEMQKGLLPVLWTIALLGVIVGGTVITLMLYGAVIEKREDFALLKALGASQRRLLNLLLTQSIAGTLAGTLLGAMITVLVLPLMVRLVPEMIVSLTPGAWMIVCFVSILLGAVSSYVPIRKLGQIYPAEVFRA